MRFLLFGSTGFLGGELQRAFARLPASLGYEFVAASASVRLEDRPALVAELARVQPDRVICAAGTTGRPNVDWCETHREETIRMNVTGTMNLVDACAVHGVHLVLFGSGCVYQYDDAHAMHSGVGFSEADAPNFVGSFYSRMRGVLETLLETYLDRVAYLRMRLPLSSDLHPRSVLTKILGYERVVNIPNSITVFESMLPIAIDMSAKRVCGKINFTNPGVVTHNELLQRYKDRCDPSFTWTNFTLDEQARVLKAGRSNCELDCTRLLALYPDIPPASVALDQAFEGIARAYRERTQQQQQQQQRMQGGTSSESAESLGATPGRAHAVAERASAIASSAC